MAVPKRKPVSAPKKTASAPGDRRRMNARGSSPAYGPQRTHQSTDEQWAAAAQNRTTTGMLFGEGADQPKQDRATNDAGSERRQYQPAASITPGTPTVLRDARENYARTRRVDPNTVQVERKKKRKADPRHRPTIDEVRKAEAESEGTGEQILEEARNKTKKKKRAITLVRNLTPLGRAQQVRRFMTQKNKFAQIKEAQEELKEASKKLRLARGTVLASTTIAKLYAFQLLFGILALLGLAIASDFETTDVLTELIFLVANLFGTGEILFAIGFFPALVLGVITFVLVGSAYTANGINPVHGKGLVGLILTLALLPATLGIVPCAYMWIAVIVYEHLDRKNERA